MDTMTGKPWLLKQANLCLIRKVIKEKRTATRAEIAQETKISSTTVRSLLEEMLQNGELESIGYDKSSGGRKARRYGFMPNRYLSVAFCITGSQVHSLLVNVYGEILERVPLEVTGGNFELAITRYLDELLAKKEIKSIGIGVPGAVEGGSFWRKNKYDDELYKVDLGDRIFRRYNIPVILENDLNAATIGFGHCYEKEFPLEGSENVNMTYLYFEKGCVSAGILAGGKIVRGCNNFAGELGLVPLHQGKLLDEYMSESMDDSSYTKLVLHVICWICGILNPRYVVVGGPDLRKSCIGPIGDGLYALLPAHLCAEILYSPDMWKDYYSGMAYLTAGKIFEDVQLVKE